MYTININKNNTERCDHCQNTYFEYIGTQAWCTFCNKTIKNIEQQVRVVPKMYQANCQNKVSSSLIRIKKYLNQFGNKYGGMNDNEELLFLYHQVLELKNEIGANSKNYRQNSAVIAFTYFMDCHRMSIKQFCKKNQIQLKSFNRSYLAYQKIIKQKKQIGSCNNIQKYNANSIKQQQFKIQCKQQDEQSQVQQNGNSFRQRRNDCLGCGQEQLYFCELNVLQQSCAKNQNLISHLDKPQPNKSIQSIQFHHIKLNRQVRFFLLAVFDFFFSSLLYKEKKSQIVEQLIIRVIQIYQTLKSLFQSQNSSVYLSLQGSINDENFYKYLFYLVLRKISHGISQVKYKKIIKDTTGQSIKSSVLKLMIKVIDIKQETVSLFSTDSFFIQNSGTTGSELIKFQQKQ